MPQLAVAVIGAEIGATAFGAGVVAFGLTGAQIGFAAGSLIGGVLFSPTQKSTGPRLSDLKAAQVAYGSVIPYIQGHPRLAGVIVWASEKREIATTTSQGKGGGGESTTFTYEQDVMFMVAENECATWRRIWKNGELVASQADGSTDAVLAAATEHWDELVFYDGNASQLPDPTYEAAVGVGNAPAYRTRTTIMLRGLKLGNSGQLPNITFEIVVEPGGTTVDTGANPPVFMALFDDGTYNDTGTGAIVPSVGPDASLSTGKLQCAYAAFAGSDSTVTYSGTSVNRASGQLVVIEAKSTLISMSPSNARIFEYRDNSAAYWHSIAWRLTGGVVRWSSTEGADLETSALAGGERTFRLRLNADGSSSLAIDGVVVLTRGITTAVAMANAFLQLGTNLGLPYDYLIDDVKLWHGEPAVGSGSGRQTLMEPTLQQVVERQCTRAGLDLAYVDASALATRNLHALVISQLSSPRSVIEMLMAAYGFQAVESDKLRFSWRGADPVATIPWADLIAADDPMPFTKANDLELPVQVFVKYMNIDDDYQDGNESSDRMISGGQNTSQVEFPLGFTPTEAKRIADFNVTDAVASGYRFGPVGLDRGYSYVEPSDVINVTSQDGSVTFRLRLGKCTEAAGIRTFEALSDDAATLTSVLHTDTTGLTNSTDVRLPIDTVLALMDIPLLSDADDGPGFYADVKAATDVSFPGAALFKSDDDVTFANVGTSIAEGVFGTAQTILASGPVGVFDEGHVVTVDVGFGELASSTRAVLLAGNTNLMLVGSELIQFRDAALVSPGVYILSGLLRGRRGTEWAVGGHVASETVVLLDSAVKHVALSNAELGIGKFYKGVTLGRTTATATSQPFTANGVSSKPYAVADVRKSDAGGGTFALSWRRRSRFGSRFLGPLSSSVPLGEVSEAYAVDVLNGSNVLQSTQTVTTNAATVTASSGWKARVYQLSATVGRGYVAEITL